MSSLGPDASNPPSLFDHLPDDHLAGSPGGPAALGATWPPQERFPLNEAGRRVEKTISDCYEASSSFTIVTGFTSIEHLLGFFSRHEIGARTIDIVLGNEPSTSDSLYDRAQPIEKQAQSYWMRRGVSVLTGGGVVRLIDAIDRGQVRFFALADLHAKIYAGDPSAILGSSNFSRQGLRLQREANSRFERGTRRYDELCQIARQYREEGRSCNAEIRALLEKLLQPVQWQEALARAAAEILEGEWVSRYPSVFRLLQQQSLWPHQEQAIAQGLWILDTRGSVLVADATGSGKTRVGTHLLYGLLNRLWSKGQAHRTRSTVICPPSVTENWSMEIQASPASSVKAISHGKLSQANDLEKVHRLVRESNVLFLDEAHNYLASGTTRSKAVEASAPDYTALLTATPINRGSGDLLRMIELLGLDNLSDREFEIYTALRRKSNLTSEDERRLRGIVRQCTIRRTKQDLNRWVERKPEGYQTEEGSLHRYPEHVCRTYATGETGEDKRLAGEINDLAGRLKGLLWLRRFMAPPWIVGDEEKERRYLENSIRAAAGLMAHTVRSALQSSRAALLEVIYGTAEAARHVGLDASRKEASGNYVERVEELRGDPPGDHVNLKIGLPAWLDSRLEATIEQEKDLLRQIGEKASCISAARMEARAIKIEEIAEREPVLLAFGARPLTLYHLQKTLFDRGFSHDVLVADGSLSSRERKAITRRLGLGQEGRQLALQGERDGLIALCSDAMSEGLNLQRAASVVLLDTPSVIRIAEQRVGRIDRMNSPHEAITVWWPDDSPPFQSQKRDLLLERFTVNGRLMGNNIKLPASIEKKAGELFSEDSSLPVSTSTLIEEYEAHQAEGPGERLEDAFQPVRQLVGLEETRRAPEPLIPRRLYEQIAGADAAVWSRITIRTSESRWGFFCLRGREGRAPRWVLLRKGGRKDPEGLGFGAVDWTIRTRLGPIAGDLRTLLQATRPVDDQRDLRLWGRVQEELGAMLDRIRKGEWELLSNRARHALGLLRNIIVRYESAAERGSERERICRFLRQALSKGKEPLVDMHELADEWLGIVQPRYVEWKQAAGGRRDEPIRLKDMEGPLLLEPIETDALRALARSVRGDEPLERRIAAAIIALPVQ